MKKFSLKMRVVAVFIFMVASINNAKALDYYWVGGSGDWSDINHWSAVSGNSPMQLHTVTPTSADNVIIDSLSFPSSGGTISINLSIAFCKDLIIRDIPANVNVVFWGSDNVLRIFGDVRISDTLNWTGNGKVKLEGSGTNAISIRGVTLPNLYINSFGSTWLVEDSLEIGSLYVDYGTLNLDKHSLKVNRLRASNSSVLLIDSSDVDVSYSFNVNGAVQLEATGAFLYMSGVNGSVSINASNVHSFDRIEALHYLEMSASNKSETLVLDLKSDARLSGQFKADSLLLDSTSSLVVVSGSSLIFNSISAAGSCESFIDIMSSGLGTKATISHSSGLDTLAYIRTRDIIVTGVPLQVNFLENIAQSSTGFVSSQSLAGKKMYWVNGSGDWDDAQHWSLTEGGPSGACVPSLMDTVIFSDSSSIGSLTVYMPSKEVKIASLYAGASFGINLWGSKAMSLDGTLSLDSNVNLSHPLRFIGNDSNYTIKTTNNTLGTITFLGQGKWTLEDDLKARNIHPLNGKFDIRNRRVDASRRFSDDRSDISPTNTQGMSCFILADSSVIKTNFFLSGSQMTASTIGSKIWMDGFKPKAQTTSLIEWDTLLVAGSSIGELRQYNDFNIAHFKSSCRITGTLTTDSVAFDKGKAFWINNLITNAILADGDCGMFIDFDAHNNVANWDLGGSNDTISYTILKNTAVSNGALTANASFDNSGNSGITFSQGNPRVLYWVEGNGNWADSTHWSLVSGGSGGECVPTPVDSVVIDVNSDTTGSTFWQISHMSPSYVKDIYVSSDATLWGMNGGYDLNVYGSIHFDQTISVSCPTNLLAIKKNEVLKTSYSRFSNIEFQADSSSFTLLDSLNANRMYHNSGNIEGNGQVVVVNNYYGNGDTLFNASSRMRFGSAYVSNTWNAPSCDIKVRDNFTLSGQINLNNSVLELWGSSPHLTMNSSDTLNRVLFSNLSGHGKYTANSNGIINHLEFLGDGTFKTDAYCDTVVFSNGHSYYVQENSEVTINDHFDCDGDFCNPILIRSTNQGVQGNIHLKDTLSGEFLEIRDINSSGPAPFYAGSRSADQGNNTNIVWANKPGYVWGFGPDRYLLTCEGSQNDSVQIFTDEFEDALGFTWSDGSTNPTFSTNEEGEYWVIANYGGCDVPDTIAIFFDTVELDLTSNYFCTGDTMSLIPVRDTFSSHVDILWNDGTNDLEKSFLVTKDTVVWVQVQDFFGNSCTDTVYSSLVSSDLLPDSLSLMNCRISSLDSAMFIDLLGTTPDSLSYELLDVYDSLNNVYDGMVELTALYNTCIITDSVYVKLDSVGSVIPEKNVFCPGSIVTWETNHPNSDFSPYWYAGSNSSASIQEYLFMDSNVYFIRTDDLGNVCGDTLRYTVDSLLVSSALTSTTNQGSWSVNVLAPYQDTLLGNVFGEGNSYLWYMNGVAQDSGIGTYDSLILNLVDTGWYSIGFVGYDTIYGCYSYSFLNLNVSAQAGSYIPNAFTPNGDNTNDLWVPVINSSDPQGVITRIYDGYGNKVYEAFGTTIGWDGTNLAGVDCVIGTYVVQCSFLDLSGNLVQSVSYVSLLR